MIQRLIKSLEDQLTVRDFRLNSLLEVTSAINSNAGVHDLVRIYEFILSEQLGFRKFILFNYGEEWNTLVKVGFRGKLNIEVQKELYRFSDITVIESSHSKVISEFDVVVPVYQNGKPLAFLLLSDLRGKERKRTSRLDNLNFVQTLTNIIVVAVENQRLAKLNLIRERIKKELEVASEMQKLLFPSELPSNRRMDISAKYTPRHEVGGDYYDFIPLGDDEYIVCIADVSGKGIGAAMLMANFQATIRTLFNYHRFDMEFLMEELNKKVIRSAKGEKFITFFISHYNANSRELTYVNAGHNHPFITNGRKVEMLSSGCIGLGMMDELPFVEVGRKKLKPNTTIVLYTDGVVELENEKAEFFGTERLVKLVHNYYPLKMEDLNNLIFSKLDEWRGDLELVDDTAIFSCRFF
ncbi:MAG: PP2C family protein-serine/threonine phosphatase [Cryomorphaceae bacterium]|jgi:sigma-B regulation protein RsbU (phosphoserine phosphatase)|nr:PP2C family protein-serine/threonine phosphatase [Cryomorphaceae bacterium]